MAPLEVLALIPARSGSKGIAHKNIRVIAGKPMLAYSILHARASRRVSRTIVSTDSATYARIARAYGAEAPFLRPAYASGDDATDLQVFLHALQWLDRHEGYRPDICVHLRPTSPVRNPRDIDAMVDVLIRNPRIDSVRSIVPAPHTPWKMWFRDNAGLLRPVVASKRREPYNLPRQRLPGAYLQNACIDVAWTRTIRDQQSMSGARIYGYLMDDYGDIDTEVQLNRVRRILRQQRTR